MAPPIVATVTLEATTRAVEAPFDLSLPLHMTVADIAGRLGEEPNHTKFVLRAANVVVKDSAALANALRDHVPLVLDLSPKQLAHKILLDMVDPDEAVATKALYNLQHRFRDKEFFKTLVANNGIEKLKKVTLVVKGNALSYALNSLQILLELHDSEQSNFSEPFIHNLLDTIQSETLLNICYPASSVIIKLISDPAMHPSSDPLAKPVPETHQTKVFASIESFISKQPAFIPTLISRLTSKSYILQITSMSLINAMLHKSIETALQTGLKTVRLFTALENGGIRPVLVTLWLEIANEASMGELRMLMVEFQRLLIKEWVRQKRIRVAVSLGSEHERVLMEVWNLAGLEADPAGRISWRRLGFDSETPKKEFSRIGVFGLQMTHWFASTKTDYFARFMQDQSVKTPEKRCPFARACCEVLEIMCDYWEISTGYRTATTIEPFILEFERFFNDCLLLFFRLWLEMEAQNTPDDIGRVGATVRSHFRHCMMTIPVLDFQCFSSFEREMLSTAYSVIRERQLKELNNDDALLTKRPFRILREKLYEKNYEFIKDQRIGCLMNGAWFPIIKDSGRVRGQVRFYRLNPNRQFLHYGEFREPGSAPDLAQLDHKIEVSSITEILTGLTSPIFKDRKRSSANIQEPPSLTFSITSSLREDYETATATSPTSTTLADFCCANPTQYSEWVDGFCMLLDKNICTQETAVLILQLTQHELSLSLLSVVGNALEISDGVAEVPEPPSNMDFYFDSDGRGGEEGEDGLQEGVKGLKSLLTELNELKVKELLDLYDSEEEN
ncbi:hypothetical protein HDU98_005703 [Podochytrium sp. JEL0797]|nr:hypothetical protein HDU98_005703 [Podochytrium sp. JEL0797]